MSTGFYEHLSQTLDELRAEGLYKSEREITTPQRARIGVREGEPVLNLCANNYLGLADHPEVIAATRDSLDEWGFGMASVRFICGTQTLHRELEKRISDFLGTEETILYPSCFDANGGLFETLLTKEDAIISDSLNHASIIDGIRLCKAARYRYKNSDMGDLDAQLTAAKDARFRMIATDGVFSMDGYVAKLPEICDLADQHDALVMLDDCHAVGFFGPTGRGTPEYHGVTDRIDLITGTLGKALGGASGGYTSGKAAAIEMLRQRSRPYLFSNTLAPPLVAGAMKVFDLLERSDDLRNRLRENTTLFRERMTAEGFEILPGDHPIVPVMLGDAAFASRMADALLERGLYVIAFSYPVVPRGQARIRCQVSAVHTPEDLEFAVEQFVAVREEIGQSV